MPKQKLFTSEAALCAAFIASIGKDWTAYAETQGYDILLARVADGLQVGVQAKLRLTPMVLAQALETESRHGVHRPMPDYLAVLVPWDAVAVGMTYLCAHVGVTVVRMPARGRPEPPLPGMRHTDDDWYERIPAKRCKLPEYVPDVAAGARSPLQLTQWKISALKIAVLLEVNGAVTRGDFRHVGIDHRRWIAPGNDWLQLGGAGWVAGKRMPDFRRQHPTVYEQIKSDIAKWSPQRGLL